MREVRGEGQNEGREKVCDLIKTGTAEKRRPGERGKGKRVHSKFVIYLRRIHFNEENTEYEVIAET